MCTEHHEGSHDVAAIEISSSSPLKHPSSNINKSTALHGKPSMAREIQPIADGK
jgi:hypothetical protein